MTKTKNDQAAARQLAESVAIDLRVVLNDARRVLDEFETYVDSWDEALASFKDPASGADPRSLTEEYVVVRALEKLEEVSHVHTGSTRMSNVHTAQRRLIQLVSVGKAE